MTSVKRTVQTAFLDAGLTLEKDALSAFVSFVEENQGEESIVYSLLDACIKGNSSVISRGPLKGSLLST
jgi:hypothetical protein